MTGHLFDSLQSAAKLAVIQPGFDLKQMKLDRWAVTYRCSVDDVRDALNIAANGSRKLPEEVAASTSPVAAFEGDDG